MVDSRSSHYVFYILEHLARWRDLSKVSSNSSELVSPAWENSNSSYLVSGYCVPTTALKYFIGKGGKLTVFVSSKVHMAQQWQVCAAVHSWIIKYRSCE